MPRYRTAVVAIQAHTRAELVNALAGELQRANDVGADTQGRPTIYEQPISETDTFHVIVLWEQWHEVPTEQRGSIILDAYDRADPEMTLKITVAMGVTLNEALRLHLLSYQVSTMRKSTDPVSYEQLEAAMRSEGAVETPAGLRMYFPTEELARDAVNRLSRRIAGPYWAIAVGEEVPDD